jgi:regulator of protease activity HflC (stomatin/prohibitin superfamily)
MSTRQTSPLGQAVAVAFTVLFAVVGVLAVVHVAGGSAAVPPGERAVILRLGAVDRIAGPGLALALPAPIETVIPVPGPERMLTTPLRALAQAPDTVPAGCALTGDGALAQLDVSLVWQVADPAAYVRAGGRGDAPGERLDALIAQAGASAVVSACAGRGLDTVMLAGASAADRDRLRADIAGATHDRLNRLGTGIAVVRAVLTTTLPAQAQAAYDAVLAESQAVDRRTAEARAAADRTLQAARARRAAILADATADAADTEAAARGDAARLRELAEAADGQRGKLLNDLYRQRIEAILRRAGTVIAVDGRTPIDLALPGAER